MRHLPNLLTLANLFFGCMAIAFILGAQNFIVSPNHLDYIEVPAMEQPYWGSIFIGLAALCDMLDGLAARGLRIFSPIGADLDSLADVVSFGVAPAMILFKLLWSAYMAEPGALDVSMLLISPAFLVACFAALRLARFNVNPGPKGGFQGMPTPAVGVFVAAFPLIDFYNPMDMAAILHNKWFLYGIIALLCWLMVSNIRFIKLTPARWKPAYFWPQLLLVVATLAALPFLGIATAFLSFGLYILLSLISPPKMVSGEQAS